MLGFGYVSASAADVLFMWRKTVVDARGEQEKRSCGELWKEL